MMYVKLWDTFLMNKREASLIFKETMRIQSFNLGKVLVKENVKLLGVCLNWAGQLGYVGYRKVMKGVGILTVDLA